MEMPESSLLINFVVRMLILILVLKGIQGFYQEWKKKKDDPARMAAAMMVSLPPAKQQEALRMLSKFLDDTARELRAQRTRPPTK